MKNQGKRTRSAALEMWPRCGSLRARRRRGCRCCPSGTSSSTMKSLNSSSCRCSPSLVGAQTHQAGFSGSSAGHDRPQKQATHCKADWDYRAATQSSRLISPRHPRQSTPQCPAAGRARAFHPPGHPPGLQGTHAGRLQWTIWSAAAAAAATDTEMAMSPMPAACTSIGTAMTCIVTAKLLLGVPRPAIK